MATILTGRLAGATGQQRGICSKTGNRVRPMIAVLLARKEWDAHPVATI